ncbi:MAG: hypothetical protein Q9225_001366 [Loekoesia sp. 1 TL-2023]
MTQKRKAQPLALTQIQSKRARYGDGDAEGEEYSTSQAQVDLTYGQRGAFPGLDDVTSEADLFYGPASDGLEYLRMVRSEAKGVPNLLTAPRRHATEEQENLYEDYPQAYYDDGAYVAIPSSSIPPHTAVNETQDLDPQETYYASLLDQFHTLSSFLRSPSSAPSAPSPSTITTAATLNAAPRKKWRTSLLYTPPTTSLLAQLSQDAVIDGIAALERFLDWRMLERGESVGAWAWGLLARCREVGMMGSEEVGVIRELGKKAKGMVRELMAGLGRGADAVAEDESEGEEGDEETEETGYASENVVEGLVSVASDPANGGGGDLQPENGLPQSSLANDEAAASSEGQKDSDENDMAEAQMRLLATLQGDDSSSPVKNPPTPVEDGTKGTHQPNNDKSPLQPTSSAQISSSLPQDTESDMNPQSDAADQDDSIPLTTRITATLDMIVTIVGEEYGQRDLLGGRLVWD